MLKPGARRGIFTMQIAWLKSIPHQNVLTGRLWLLLASINWISIILSLLHTVFEAEKKAKHPYLARILLVGH